MTKRKTTKRALFSSAVSLLLCVCMMLGTTFAWFTDEATTGVNTIQSGTLDVDLVDQNDVSLVGSKLSFMNVKGDTDILWEPGVTFLTQGFKVVNNGNLALKYKLVITGIDGDAKLLEAIEFWLISPDGKPATVEALEGMTRVDLTEEFNLNPKGKSLIENVGFESDLYYLVAHMDEEAGNEYQDLKLSDVGITVYATQVEAELDSFDNKYDTNATYEPWAGDVASLDEFVSTYDAATKSFVISTGAQLAKFAEIVNSGAAFEVSYENPVATLALTEEETSNVVTETVPSTFNGYIVKLADNIDLNNMPWTPVGNLVSYPGITFKGTFDGNGYTIKNLYAIDTTVNHATAGFFGSTSGATVKNVTFENPTVISTHYAGVVVGYEAANSLTTTIENVTVNGATVISTPELLESGEYDNGDKVGGIVGYATSTKVVNCTVKNSTITGYRDIGGVMGFADGKYGASVVNCVVESVKLICDTTYDYKAYDSIKKYDINEVVGEVANDAVVSGNTENGIEILYSIASGVATNDGDEYVITNADGLYWLAEQVNGGNTFSGKTVKLGADIDLEFADWTPIGNSTYSFQGTFDGLKNAEKNTTYTISNLYINMPGKSNVGLFGMTTNGAIKNLTVNNAKVVGRLNVGVVAGTPYTSTYENITVKGHVEVDGMSYVGGVGGKNAYANWTDITVKVDDTSYVKADSIEWSATNNAYVNYRTYVGGVVGFMGEGTHTFKNVTSNIDVYGSTCDVGGIVGIAHYGNSFINCSSSGNVTITNVAVDDGDQYEIGGIAGVWHNGDGATVTFTDCEYTGTLSSKNTDGSAVTDFWYNGLVGKSYNTTGTGTLIIDGVKNKVVASADALASALADSCNVMLANDIELTDTITVPAGVTTTLNLNGYTVSQTKACTASYSMISNNGTLTINGNGKLSFTDTGAGDPDSGWASYTIRNNGTLVVENGTIEHLGTQTYNGNNAIFHYSGSTTINGGTISAPYSRSLRVWNGSVTINGGTFDGQVWVQAMSDCKLTINGGSFKPATYGNDGSSVFVTTDKHNPSVSVTGGYFATKFGCSDATKLAGCITGGEFTETARANTNSALFAN